MKLIYQSLLTLLFFVYVGIICLPFTWGFGTLLTWAFDLKPFWEIVVILLVFFGLWSWLDEAMNWLIFWVVVKINGIAPLMRVILILYGLAMTANFIALPWVGAIQPEPNLFEKLLTGFLGLGFLGAFYALSKVVTLKKERGL